MDNRKIFICFSLFKKNIVCLVSIYETSCIKNFRTIESLYEELVKEGIIVRCPQIRLSEFEGEYSYLGTTLRQANIEPMPSLSDVRRLVTEFGILPLGKPLVVDSL